MQADYRFQPQRRRQLIDDVADHQPGESFGAKLLRSETASRETPTRKISENRLERLVSKKDRFKDGSDCTT